VLNFDCPLRPITLKSANENISDFMILLLITIDFHWQTGPMIKRKIAVFDISNRSVDRCQKPGAANCKKI